MLSAFFQFKISVNSSERFVPYWLFLFREDIPYFLHAICSPNKFLYKLARRNGDTMFYATLLLWRIIYASSEKPSRLPNVSAQRHVFRGLNKSNSTSRSRFSRSHLPPFSVATAIVTTKSSLAFYMYIHRRRQDLKALIKKNSIHTAHGKDAGLMGRKGGKGEWEGVKRQIYSFSPLPRGKFLEGPSAKRVSSSWWLV